MSEQLKPYEQIGVAMTCRSFDEYVHMFGLEPQVLESGPMLDVAAGASSFVAEARARGYRAVAADPMYALEPEAIEQHGSREIALSTAKLDAVKEQFDWSYYRNITNHQAGREASLQRFVDHYRENRDNGIYTQALLPDLPFPDESFALITVSHFLFLYEGQFDRQFHLDAIRELLRVCRRDGEIRIYPVFTLRWDRYPHLEELLAELGKEGVRSSMLESRLPFIPGSKEVLRLTYESARSS